MSTPNVTRPIVKGNPPPVPSPSAPDALPGQLRELEDATHELLVLQPTLSSPRSNSEYRFRHLLERHPFPA